jgi:hypothetical protein
MGSASGSFGNAEVTTGDSRSGEESVHQPAEAEDDTITPRLSDQDGAVAICGGCGIVGGSACLLLFDTFAFRFETSSNNAETRSKVIGCASPISLRWRASNACSLYTSLDGVDGWQT